jgi:PST family polysaccharide transporter
MYSRAWRQGLYAAMVFIGALLGQYRGITGVAVGVLIALFLNYLLMAQFGLRMGGISWLRFAEVQLPAIWLTMAVGGVTLALMVGTRHVGLPPVVSLVAGSTAAVLTALLAVWLAPTLTLGEHGIRMRDLLSTRLLNRLRPMRARGSA